MEDTVSIPHYPLVGVAQTDDAVRVADWNRMTDGYLPVAAQEAAERVVDDLDTQRRGWEDSTRQVREEAAALEAECRVELQEVDAAAGAALKEFEAARTQLQRDAADSLALTQEARLVHATQQALLYESLHNERREYEAKLLAIRSSAEIERAQLSAEQQRLADEIVVLRSNWSAERSQMLIDAEMTIKTMREESDKVIAQLLQQHEGQVADMQQIAQNEVHSLKQQTAAQVKLAHDVSADGVREVEELERAFEADKAELVAQVEALRAQFEDWQRLEREKDAQVVSQAASEVDAAQKKARRVVEESMIQVMDVLRASDIQARKAAAAREDASQRP